MSDSTLLVMGLGNPGPEHRLQRHNVGAEAVRALGERLGARRGRYSGPAVVARARWGETELVLAQPLTFMNSSGQAGVHLTRTLGLGLDQVVVVYDDLDLPLGRLRLRAGGSPGGHNGIKSLQNHWRSQQFSRVRIGIGRPPEGVDPIEYVLGRPSDREREELASAELRAGDAVLKLAEVGIAEAMTEFNRSVSPSKGAPKHDD